MDILRFITAGNVDDGKSTLIGRLLYDTRSLKDDVLATVSENGNAINLAHITDGLRSERAQGITIDVAYKYYATSRRKYIIIDAPGHFQYTKNLVTGASNADAIIILIDAQHGITEQTKRHSQVASFLKTPNVVVAINKMDIVDYNEQVFQTIKNDFLAIAKKLSLSEPAFIPISALCGDNVSFPSIQMPWYTGNTIEQYLEACKPPATNQQFTRFSVQYVKNGFVFGRLLSGSLSVNDNVAISGKDAFVKINKINRLDKDIAHAIAGEDICLVVSGEKTPVRGDIIYCGNPPSLGNQLTVTLCWLDAEQPLQPRKEYLLRIDTQEVLCNITRIDFTIDVDTLVKKEGAAMIKVNEFAQVRIETHNAITFDAFSTLPATGQGIIIDKETNYTSGAVTIN